MTSSIAGLVLAGGSSRRMGRDKALLPMPGQEHLTFLSHLITVLATVCSEIALVTRDEEQAITYTKHLITQELGSVQSVHDKVPSAGPLMGIYSGLSALQASHALVLAVDMPFVQQALLAFLLSFPLDNTLLMPVVNGIPQVLLAIYPRTLLPIIAACLQSGRRDPRSILAIAPVHYIEEAQLRTVDPLLRSFVNVNTPHDLQKL